MSVSRDEIDWWETNRPDIADYVDGGEIWYSPVTGKQMLRCPWLRKLPNQNKFACRIYFDRPDECKHYPTTISEMIRDGCEMLEPRDLKNPAAAQDRLDVLMSDSRPALHK